jgi:hypothetical protein
MQQSQVSSSMEHSMLCMKWHDTTERKRLNPDRKSEHSRRVEPRESTFECAVCRDSTLHTTIRLRALFLGTGHYSACSSDAACRSHLVGRATVHCVHGMRASRCCCCRECMREEHHRSPSNNEERGLCSMAVEAEHTSASVLRWLVHCAHACALSRCPGAPLWCERAREPCRFEKAEIASFCRLRQ